MERESFEDEATARLMNESFVCVKVDREERPDVDALYMEAVQGMTGRGGWPLNVFLTPEQLPFYGGTYFPPEPRHGMPSWPQVLNAIAESWEQNSEEISAGGERVRERLSGGAHLDPSSRPPTRDELEQAVQVARESFDAVNGGFGERAQVPAGAGDRVPARPRRARDVDRDAARDGLAAGSGTRSQAASPATASTRRGRSRTSRRCSTTTRLLARAYLHGWQATGEEALREACVDTLEWALSEMRGPEGAFYSALDADSEGVEGRFYVWTVQQICGRRRARRATARSPGSARARRATSPILITPSPG